MLLWLLGIDLLLPLVAAGYQLLEGHRQRQTSVNHCQLLNAAAHLLVDQLHLMVVLLEWGLEQMLERPPEASPLLAGSAGELHE